MSAAQIKAELHRYIDLADNRMAEALLAMFKNYFSQQKEEIVAYTIRACLNFNFLKTNILRT